MINFSAPRRRDAGAVPSALLFLAVVMVSATPLAAQTEPRWITDDIGVDVRRGKSLQHAIVRMAPSGTAVVVLEHDKDAGYSRIRLPGGDEGWILTRYLVSQPPARTAMPGVLSRLEKTVARNKEAENEVRELRAERDRLAEELAAASSTRDEQREELAEIRRLSAGAIELNESNQTLQARLVETEQQATELAETNRRLSRASSRDWFLVGAATVIIGIVLGLVLPRIRFKRRSTWDRF